MLRGGIGTAVRDDRDAGPFLVEMCILHSRVTVGTCTFECEVHVSASGGARRGLRPGPPRIPASTTLCPPGPVTAPIRARGPPLPARKAQ